MAVEQNGALRLARNLDEQERRAAFELQHFKLRARQMRDLRHRPGLVELHRLGHVAMLLPFGIEGRRLVRDADVFDQRGKYLVIPELVDEGGYGHGAVCRVMRRQYRLVRGKRKRAISKPTSSS